jgi:hypothetical protein
VDGRKLKNFTRAVVEVCRRHKSATYCQPDVKEYPSYVLSKFVRALEHTPLRSDFIYPVDPCNEKINYSVLAENLSSYSPAPIGYSAIAQSGSVLNVQSGLRGPPLWSSGQSSWL